jgi:hypothetical protein
MSIIDMNAVAKSNEPGAKGKSDLRVWNGPSCP